MAGRPPAGPGKGSKSDLSSEWTSDQRSPVRKPRELKEKAAQPFVSASKKANAAVRSAKAKTKPRGGKPSGDPKADIPILAHADLAQVNWEVVYAEFMAGDAVSAIAVRHRIAPVRLKSVITACGWEEERHKHFLNLQRAIKDRLEDVTIDETEKMVRAHFNLMQEGLELVRDLRSKVTGPKDLKDWIGAADLALKAQRLAAGLTNYVADPNGKGGKADSDLAEDLDNALGLLEGEG